MGSWLQEPSNRSVLSAVVLPRAGQRCDKAKLFFGFQLIALSCFPRPGISPGFAVMKVWQLHCRSNFEALTLKESRGSIFMCLSLSCQNVDGCSSRVLRNVGRELCPQGEGATCCEAVVGFVPQCDLRTRSALQAGTRNWWCLETEISYCRSLKCWCRRGCEGAAGCSAWPCWGVPMCSVLCSDLEAEEQSLALGTWFCCMQGRCVQTDENRLWSKYSTAISVSICSCEILLKQGGKL